MKNNAKPIIYFGVALVFVFALILTSIISKGPDNSVTYEKEIAALEAELKDVKVESAAKDARLETCINVMDNSIMANAYFLVGFTDTPNIAKYYSLATEAMNEYDSTDTDACRDDS